MNELSESLSEYMDRWHGLLPQRSVWSTPTTEADLGASVLECTCDLMVLMHGGCRCGTMRQEREAK